MQPRSPYSSDEDSPKRSFRAGAFLKRARNPVDDFTSANVAPYDGIECLQSLF